LNFLNNKRTVSSIFKSNSEINFYSNEYDYVAFVPWASFSGRLNKTPSLVWIEKLSQLKTKKMKVINLNLDLKEKQL
tara:strand:+ start:4510 stop:4740 length:231 start_codon:yes stop_codon:yes gene_type:complete